MENKTFLEKLKFGIGDGNLQYYLYNWKCPGMEPEKVSVSSEVAEISQDIHKMPKYYSVMMLFSRKASLIKCLLLNCSNKLVIIVISFTKIFIRLRF